MANKSGTGKKASRTANIRSTYKELVCVDAGASPVVPLALPANGTSEISLGPMGIRGVTLGSGVFVASSVEPAHLKGLFLTASNFKEYRVTRAHLVIVGNVSSTATGNFSVFSSKDFGDIRGPTTPSYATTGPGTSVASLANKDYRVALDFDSSWKKCTNSTLGLSVDFKTICATNSVNDITFCSLAVSNNSNTALGVPYLDYDVEFRGPINPAINL